MVDLSIVMLAYQRVDKTVSPQNWCPIPCYAGETRSASPRNSLDLQMQGPLKKDGGLTNGK